MTPIHYKAKVLPDGHLPIPEGSSISIGQEVEITLMAADLASGDGEAEPHVDNLLKKWAGIGRGSGSGMAARHDDALYGR